MYLLQNSDTSLSILSLSRRKPFLTGSLPRMMFSTTVKLGISMKCWWTIPMPSLRASPGPWILASSPSTRILPLSGLYRP